MEGTWYAQHNRFGGDSEKEEFKYVSAVAQTINLRNISRVLFSNGEN